jgi:hypothetical protein
MRSTIALLGLAVITSAHFVLQIPPNIGFDDEVEDQEPCGSFSPTNRSGTVSNFDVAGDNIAVLTTHTTQTWHISGALLSSVDNWVLLIPDISQQNVGTFCEPSVPAPDSWAGQDGVIQVIQNSPDGILYQV